ncbi:uncharacterized protein LOC111373757 [Olea europaea var. sylvestris]|uniref:uncharacterized protein LOC111373757 n=1 Tax=Olea europaea var. sylvestris TaxID=158386 RepID=UPI000C1D5D34|nr:uncharacterized protein LOC111373757 [Olea europaea var. sylvestris]
MNPGVRDNGEVVSESKGEYDEMPTLVDIGGEDETKFAVGELLVSRQALNTQIKTGDLEQQRENIFYTRCHIYDQWLNESGKARVNKWVLINFSVGRENLAHMMGIGTSIALSRMGDKVKLKNEEERQAREFTKRREDSEPMSKRENNEMAERGERRERPHERREKESVDRREKPKVNFFARGSELKKALSDKRQVFQRRVFGGGAKLIATVRGIEHQIDFIPGAVIPNQPAYRSNPKERNELQRQVEELMSKGYVRESMSLCVVPILLVSKKDGT